MIVPPRLFFTFRPYDTASTITQLSHSHSEHLYYNMDTGKLSNGKAADNRAQACVAAVLQHYEQAPLWRYVQAPFQGGVAPPAQKPSPMGKVAFAKQMTDEVVQHKGIVV